MCQKVLKIPKAIPLSRRKVVQILHGNGFVLSREGGRHTEFEKLDDKGKWWVTYVPRHAEISVGVIQEIIKQAGKERSEFW